MSAGSARRTPFRVVRGRALVLAAENVDTDQIVPARFLLESNRADWAAALFADWRFEASGAPRADARFPAVERGSHPILVAGRNFGCGSSREHAAWALRDFGVRVVIAPALADIFRRNALKNGLLALDVLPATHAALAAAPDELEVDLERRRISPADGPAHAFDLDAFARHCLLAGVDELEHLRAAEAAIARYEAACARRSLRVPVR